MSTFARLAERLSRALAPLTFAAQSEDGIRTVVARLGWSLPTVPPSLLALGEGLTQLGSSLASVAAARSSSELGEGDSPDRDGGLDQVAVELALVLGALHELPARLRAELPPSFIAETHIDEQLEGRVFDWLISMDLAQASAVLYRLLRLVGVIEVDAEPADVLRLEPAFEQHRIRWDRLFQLTDPSALARDVYGWGSPSLDADRLFGELLPLSFALGMPAEIRYASPAFRRNAAPGAAVDSAPEPQLWIPVLRAADAAFFLVFMPLPTALPAEAQGLALTLVPSAAGGLSIPYGEGVELTVEAAAQVGTGVALVFRPDLPPAVIFDVEGETGSGLTTGRIVAGLTWKAEDAGTSAGVSAPDRTGLSARSISVRIGADTTAGTIDPYVELSVEDGALVVARPKDDGFLASVLPEGGLNASFAVALRWSREGLRFEGSGELAAKIPLGVSLGPLFLQSLTLEIESSASGLTGTAGLTASLRLGPLGLTVDRVGLAVIARTGSGNLGPIDLAFQFKPPSGVGLVVDSAGVSGGGFLGFFPEKHQYTGVLQLEFNQLALQAFGLITTQVAGGAGYSLLALIDADFPPVQLGWGFTLNGVGGLLAIHRTASVDALRAALKADKLSTVLFPKNAITNAPQILAQLDAFFPTAPGRFLFGPMALIGWGTPTVLTAAVAIVIELPAPVRILLLARVEARLPSPTSPLVRINMDALGVLDLGQSTLSLDATLFDSKLLGFTLSGDMALRAAWAAQREFLLAIGGFHPRFTPPAGFPALQRITINMPSGIVSKLRLAAYLAITSNSVQFGAELDVFIGVSGFGLAGHLGFDALLQLDPFHFEADISGSVALTAGGDDLMSVGLDATLTGPAPWNIAGKFKVHFLFFTLHKSFSHSWGEDAPSLPPLTVDIGKLLKTALADPRSWAAQLPAGTSALVSVRKIEDQAAVLAHPLAVPEVHERIVPLGLDITRFGTAAPAADRRFTLSGLHIGTGDAGGEAIQDDFAPAQFFDLSDEEKLARPSFERHDAGLRAGAIPVASGAPHAKTLAYETFFIDEPGGAVRTDPGTPVGPLFGELILILGAAGRAASAHSANRRYQAPGAPIQVLEPAFVVVDAKTLAPALPAGNVSASGNAYSEAEALLRSANGRGALRIVAVHEMAAS